MFRRGSKSAQSAAETERQALFEKLALRPETVCPFLGLAASRADYQDQATDDHRCYAFGDPEVISGEQQRNVCLQRGYANCPRYLRGVLVIPTDELEALRRPHQRVPPPPPPPPRVPPSAAGGGGRRRTLAALLVVLLLVGAGAGAWWVLAGPGAVALETPTPRPSPTSEPSPSEAEPSSSSAPSSSAPSPTTAISGTAGLVLAGQATRDGESVRLTPSVLDQVGAAWYPDLVGVANGFSVEYTFQLGSPQLGGGDGLAFVVQTQGATALGGLGGQLGYGGLQNSLAVEVDTYLNEWPGADDPNANHVSVHTSGQGPNDADEALSIASTTSLPDLSDGQTHQIRINYDPGMLTVFVDGTQALSVALDLPGRLALGSDGTAYVGFTGATGTSAQTHDLLSLVITFP